MACWNYDNTIYIMASTGYDRKNIEAKGIRVFSPYHADNLPLRIFREICFRLPGLPKAVWYNKTIKTEGVCFVNIIDVNITEHYLKWVMTKYPKAQINFIYDNMVGKARNISPEHIPAGIRVWTYDDYDSRKYKIKLFKNYWINELLFSLPQTPEFDVFFVGKDKGRGEKLIRLENEMRKLGLKTKFIITKDKKYSREKDYYQEAIPYSQVIDYDMRSRAILNVTMENQEGVTMRDMESLAIGVKLITTNRNIVNKDLYHPNNVFVLGVDNLADLPKFLKKEFIDIRPKIKMDHTFEAMLNEITN